MQAATRTYDNEVYNFVQHKGSNADTLVFAEFKKLQRLNLVELQNELATLKGDIHTAEKVTVAQRKELRRLLSEYAQAIRDVEYMNELDVLDQVEAREQQLSLTESFQDIASKRGAPYDTRYLRLPSTLQQKPDAVREALRKYLLRSLSWTTEEKRLRRNDYYQGRPPHIYSTFVDRLARFIMAFVGGAALLIPMIIMVFDSSLSKSLATTSVSVLLFAGFLSFGISASNQDTLAATATYAAVLVVFVGTSLPSQKSST
ncbi:hypothetical protein BKA64DRAFT_585735 [Cadophora sp. MPI-SDFR-AT-0126]|nr:hypothetical protein BKA64DRAFT_585735 [Leotiomycetes sp. MPI-SDFR-AT-0126]